MFMKKIDEDKTYKGARRRDTSASDIALIKFTM